MASQFFSGFFAQKVSSSAIADTTPPTFVGITGLVAQANGSLRASWSAASDLSTPLEYKIYVQAGSATGLFLNSNIVCSTYGLTFDLYHDATNIPLTAQTYYVGVRAEDGVGNVETNTVSLSAASVGIASNSLFNQINTVAAQVWDMVRSSHATAGTFGESLQAKVDADVSTRLASASYVAPDNTDIVAIKAKTDQLAFASGRVASDISTAQETAIVAKTWNALLADYLTANSMGANMNLIDDILAVVNGFTAADVDHQLIVPAQITLPPSGSEVYRMYFRNSQAKVPTNPAAGPDIEITDSAGGIYVAYTAMTNEATGVFYYDWTVNSTDLAEQFIVKVRHKELITDPYLILIATGNRVTTQADVASIYAQTTAIKAKTDNLPADPASNTQVNTRLASTDTRLNHLDADISSRLATAGYMAPDNADIALIKAKTDNLPTDPASETNASANANSIKNLVSAGL